ncbi:MAG: flagellar biosynthesis protein FlhB [Magnetovibrio sp.]|nr:flagellar biosynthesis protein FlhB [Magnetovibrio sp.]
MSDEDDSQKTEDPTERKLSQAKEKGQVASSQEIKSLAILLGGAASMALIIPWMMNGLAAYMFVYIEQADIILVEQISVQSLFKDAMLEMAFYMIPTFAVLMVMGIVSNVAQTGLLIAPKKINPELNKISLIAGFKRMFSMRTVVEFVKGIFKITILGWVVFYMAMPWFEDAAIMPDMPIGDITSRLYLISMSIMAGSIMVMTAVATLDYAYQKFDFLKSMRMSHKDLKDEYKDMEGDPQIKAQIRKLRQERAQTRMMSNVPDADVVVTNPTHYSIALKYKVNDMQAPILVAKGLDSLAFRIREVAEENDIPIVENPPLARALYASVELDEEIPMEHYQAVAEVIGYVMKLKGK